MCHDIEKNKVIILLEINDKCKNNQNPMPQKAKVVNQTTEKRPSTLEIISKMIWQQAKWFIVVPKNPKPNNIFSNVVMVCESNSARYLKTIIWYIINTLNTRHNKWKHCKGCLWIYKHREVKYGADILLKHFYKKNSINGIEPIVHLEYRNICWNVKKFRKSDMDRFNPYQNQTYTTKWKILIMQTPLVIIKMQIPYLKHYQQYAYNWQMRKTHE